MTYESFRGERTDEPRLLYCEIDPDIEPGYKYGPVIRDVFIVESCIEGGGKILINDREFRIDKGDCYVLLPGDNVAHISDPETSRRCLCCVIDGLSIGQALKRAGISSHSPMISGEYSEAVTSLLERMIAMRDETDAGADYRRTACIYELLGVLLSHNATVNKNIWVENAIGFIETNYHKPITVTDIAESVSLDRSYFSTLFKDRTGMSPYTYLSSLRIRKACVLMRDMGYSVALAAETVGLDPQNFARLFKRVVGKTPKRYIDELGADGAVK